MPLPPKSYYLLEEVAERWGCTINDLVQYAVEEQLEVSMLTFARRVELCRMEADDTGPERVQGVLNGPQPLIGADLWPAVANGVAHINRVQPDPEGSARL